MRTLCVTMADLMTAICLGACPVGCTNIDGAGDKTLSHSAHEEPVGRCECKAMLCRIKEAGRSIVATVSHRKCVFLISVQLAVQKRRC